MISIERTRVPPPAIITSRKAESQLYAAMGQVIAARVFKGKSMQERISLDESIYNNDEVRKALTDLFFSKCAFCESIVGATGSVDVHHFRPKSNALSRDGQLSPLHYWWLIYDWDNLYSACVECSSRKGTRFPIEASQRVELPEENLGGRETRRKGLQEEKPLLLDPCLDRPEEHFMFIEDGTVAGKTERGNLTIEIFGLNRPDLQKNRAFAYEKLKAALDRLDMQLASGKIDPIDRTIEELNEPQHEYAGMRRQFIRQWLHKLSDDKQAALDSTEQRHVAEQIKQAQPVMSQTDQAAVKKGYQKFKKSVESFSVAQEQKPADYYLHTRLIRRIEISNFKSIRSLKLDFPTGKPEHAPWLMLLGENGTGKSSVLLAVALALVGDEYRNGLDIRPKEVLTRGKNKGFVKIYLTGLSAPIELRYSSDSQEFTAKPSEPKVLLLGYGATRLLPRPAHPTRSEAFKYADIDNLTDPFVPLNDAEKWMLDLDEEKFDFAALAIKDVLALDPKARFERTSGEHAHVEVNHMGDSVPIIHLSDGYQSVIALVADVMSVMQEKWKAMEVAEGIVLIDELGAHLHPRWMMQVIKRLRKTYPRVQFLVTSHDPLCLRGLYDGEVVVMRRDLKQRVIAITDLPSVEGMRIDQILTSEHFGLDSTIDPELDTLFQEYYYLLALRALNQKQKERLEELRQQLEQSKFRVFGSTPRERIMLEEIDKYLAHQRVEADTKTRQELEGEMRSNIAASLESNLSASPGTPQSNSGNSGTINSTGGQNIVGEDAVEAGAQ